eukprot:scaffold23366_cov112-Isochrysis_galbana.AAC.11
MLHRDAPAADSVDTAAARPQPLCGHERMRHRGIASAAVLRHAPGRPFPTGNGLQGLPGVPQRGVAPAGSHPSRRRRCGAPSPARERAELSQHLRGQVGASQLNQLDQPCYFRLQGGHLLLQRTHPRRAGVKVDHGHVGDGTRPRGVGQRRVVLVDENIFRREARNHQRVARATERTFQQPRQRRVTVRNVPRGALALGQRQDHLAQREERFVDLDRVLHRGLGLGASGGAGLGEGGLGVYEAVAATDNGVTQSSVAAAARAAPHLGIEQRALSLRTRQVDKRQPSLLREGRGVDRILHLHAQGEHAV